MNPTVKGFLWGASSVAALVALGYFVSKSTTPREQQQQPPMQSQQQQQDPAIQQLEASVQNDPNNLALRNDLAQAYLDRNNMMGVFEQSKFVLDKNPNDARALTLGAVVRMAMGEADTAQSMLQKATQIDPKNLDGWVALAWIYSQSGRMKDAEASIARAIQESPTNKARLEEVLQEMKSHATQPQPSPPAASSEMPPGHPPVGQTVRVTLQLDPAARVKSGIVYVIARSPQGGPPVAVRRLTVHAFPVTINFGANDSMLGQPLPPSFRLEARLDTDGDAATRTPTDPNAMQDGVSLGAAVTLALK